MAGFFKPVADGLILAVRVSPNASRAAIDGIVTDADGSQYLKIAVTVPPENGKANEAVIALLAKTLRLAKSTVSLTGGATARRKTLLIAGETRELETRITEWLRVRNAA
jgi:uncharacterized protein (TIGR00251 family)